MKETKESYGEAILDLYKLNNKKIFSQIYKHKWIITIIMFLIILASINGIMIYNFFKILQTL
mgnify:FL=1